MTRANETKSYQSMVIFVQVMIMSSCFWNCIAWTECGEVYIREDDRPRGVLGRCDCCARPPPGVSCTKLSK